MVLPRTEIFCQLYSRTVYKYSFRYTRKIFHKSGRTNIYFMIDWQKVKKNQLNSTQRPPVGGRPIQEERSLKLI